MKHKHNISKLFDQCLRFPFHEKVKEEENADDETDEVAHVLAAPGREHLLHLLDGAREKV